MTDLAFWDEMRWDYFRWDVTELSTPETPYVPATTPATADKAASDQCRADVVIPILDEILEKVQELG